MLKKRLIFTLIYSDGFFKLSRNFKLQNVGDINWLKNHYDFSKISFFIDELLILDASKNKKKTDKFFSDLNSLSAESFAPIGAGGGIDKLKDAENFFKNGTDKIILNSAAFENPKVIYDISENYGNQSICVSIDYKLVNGRYRVFINNGQNLIDLDFESYLEKIGHLPIGEVLLNSIDRDGTGQGLDLKVLNLIQNNFKLPIILAGGAGKASHLIDGLKEDKISAVSTANLYNFIGDGLKIAREEILNAKIDLPIWDNNNAKELKNIFNQ